MPSSARSLVLTLVLIPTCLVGSSCAQFVKSFAEVSKLHAAIVKEYGEKEVGVNLHNNATLIITFINSPLNSRGSEERAQRAEQAAKFVSQHYSSINQIDEIWVDFERQETRYIFVHRSESLDFFGFDKSAQPLRREEELEARTNQQYRDPADPTAPFIPAADLEPHAFYSEARKETEVRITRLQLEGDLEYGLAVVPHFTVPGDATGIRKSSVRPRTVSFDFASYSEKSMFPGEPRIILSVDGKVIFETAEQFSTSKGADERFFETVELKLPYATFRRLSAGKVVKLTMGDREYEFKGEHLKALQEMTQYVGEP